MIAKEEAIRKLLELMARQFPGVAEFEVVATPIRLTCYGFVSARWDGGKSAITLQQPYQVK